MQFELNEIEARREQYPSTISFLNLLNVLIAEERDVSDRGRRYWSLIAFYFCCILTSYACISTLILIGSLLSLSLCGRFIGIFRFIYDHVFGPFPQRAYADPCEKWQLVVACLQHFHMWVYPTTIPILSVCMPLILDFYVSYVLVAFFIFIYLNMH